MHELEILAGHDSVILAIYTVKTGVLFSCPQKIAHYNVAI